MSAHVWRDLSSVDHVETTALGFANMTLYCSELLRAERNPYVYIHHIHRIKDMLFDLVFTAAKANEYRIAVESQPEPRKFWQFYKRKPKSVLIPDYKGPPLEQIQLVVDRFLAALDNEDLDTIEDVKEILAEYRKVCRPKLRKTLEFDESGLALKY